MKMSKFRIAVLVLLAVTTVVYAVTLHQSVQTYNEWREEDRQKYAEQYGYVPSYTHFLTTKTGIVFDVAGITLFFAWSFAILSSMSKFRLAILMLLFVTVIYAASLTLVWWRYNQMPTEGYDETLGHYFVTRKSFLDTRGGFPYLCAGAVLTLMWMALSVSAREREQKKGENKNENV